MFRADILRGPQSRPLHGDAGTDRPDEGSGTVADSPGPPRRVVLLLAPAGGVGRRCVRVVTR